MGISYAPFEDSTQMVTGPPPRVVRFQERIPEKDSTECNYLVMFFVVGVFLIALSDAMKTK